MNPTPAPENTDRPKPDHSATYTGPGFAAPAGIGLHLGATIHIHYPNSYQQCRYTIAGRLDYTEDGYQWTEYRLTTHPGQPADPHRDHWLAVDLNAPHGHVLWTPLREHRELAGLTGTPGDRSLRTAGAVYKLTEHGTAEYTATGETGTPSHGHVTYVDYRLHKPRPGGLPPQLTFEKNPDGSWEGALGTPIAPGTLTDAAGRPL